MLIQIKFLKIKIKYHIKKQKENLNKQSMK